MRKTMNNTERALFHLGVARDLLKLHDQGQNLLTSGKITYSQFIDRCEFYRVAIELQQSKAIQCDENATLRKLYITKPVAKEVSWREFLNVFHQDDRYCTFSYNALVAMYHFLEDEAFRNDELLDSVDVEYLTKYWNEYDSIDHITHAMIGENDIPVTVENIDSLREYEMITPTLSQLRIYAEVLELPRGALLVQYY